MFIPALVQSYNKKCQVHSPKVFVFLVLSYFLGGGFVLFCFVFVCLSFICPVSRISLLGLMCV